MQQVRPGLARLVEAVLERDQLLGTVRAYADKDEYADWALSERTLRWMPPTRTRAVDLCEVAVKKAAWSACRCWSDG
ncbi:hypothetical protein ACWKT5_09855 [Streptomyces avermitilis]